jgi:large subunit ribosomal protein L4
MAVATYTKTGTKATTAAKLDRTVFEIIPSNHELLKSAYTAYLANGRVNLAITKTRGLVSGGGKKPWRQKGTGRARFGSSRNPIWRGGGIAFGPTGQETYKKSLPLAQKRQAVRQALSLSAKDGRIKIIETFDCAEGSVKKTAGLLKKIDAKGTILLVNSVKDNMVERATRNIAGLNVVSAKYLNVYDVLNADTIVISQKSLATIEEWLGSKK